MKVALAILMVIHGLIHSLGFVKSFNFSKVRQLVQPISKLNGLFWLIAAVLFLLTATLFWVGNKYWWIYGFVALAISQTLLVFFWNDAKYGSVANMIILVVCIGGYFSWKFFNRYEQDIKVGLQEKQYFDSSILSEKDMHHLPEPVKMYLRYTGSVGKPKVNNFKIEFSGKIRKDENSEWMPFSSEQHNYMQTPTRLFFMKAVMKHLPVAGYHRFVNGNAFMDIRLFSMFKVQFQEGGEMNRAETVTFFNDMCCMAPATLIDKRITWEAKEENVVMATFTNNGIAITADLFFNEKGQLINFTSNDRINADAGQRLPWATPLKNYRQINGYQLAGYAETIYTYPDRELCYGTFETKSVKYNLMDN